MNRTAQAQHLRIGVITEPAYPAARAAAARLHPHYAMHLGVTSSNHTGEHELLPDPAVMEAMIDVAFWASLRREETQTPRISLAFVAPSRASMALSFERPVPLAAQPLTRLGPAVERPGIHLCVWWHHGELLVWGATRILPQYCFVLEVIAPGLLVIKHSPGDDSGKFVNVAVLQGDEIKVVDQEAGKAPDCPELLTSLLGLQTEIDEPGSGSVLIELALSMRAHGKGGSLLVVPAAAQTWRDSILHPITYSISPPFRMLADLMREEPGERSHRRWRNTLQNVVDGIAGLTAVDGATIITDDFELLAFGAKIVRRAGWDQVYCISVSEPIEGTASAVVEPGRLGGTRHLSAAQFAHDQREAIALVASQDGRFTVFGWSPCQQMVYANRIETLLL